MTLQEKDTEYVVRELIEVVRMVTVEVTELQTVRARSRAFLFDTSSLGEKSASSLGEKSVSSLEGAMGWSPLESPSSSDALHKWTNEKYVINFEVLKRCVRLWCYKLPCHTRLPDVIDDVIIINRQSINS